MGAHDFRLGVDFGTSNTVAVLRWPDGRVRPLFFDGSPLLTSAVFAGLDGRIAVGRNAVHGSRAHPERFEPYPKRCIDDGTVLLGYAGTSDEPVAVPVEDLITAVLRRVAEEAARTAGRPVPHVVLTYPAGWRQARRSVLLAAANAVFPDVTLVPEPVAAASHFVGLDGAAVSPGSTVMVYDLGAGTFDASVVRRTADGFEVLSSEGISDAGGLDIDAAMMAYVGALYAGRDAATWARLSEPAAPADRRLSRTLWDDIRVGKEILSESTSVLVHIPLFDDDVPFGREQVEQLAQPILARTVALARSTLRAAGVDATDLAGLYLVGGASRIPLVATMLHRALGIAPTTIEAPELAVAEGSLRAVAGPSSAADPAPAPAPGSVTGTDVPGPPDGAGPPTVRAPSGGTPEPRRWPRSAVELVGGGARRRWVTVGIAAVAVLAVLVVVPILNRGLGADPAADGTGGNRVGNISSPTASPTPTPTPTPTPSSAIDLCLIGTWRESNNAVHFDFGGVMVRMKAAGAIRRYWPDGRGTTEFGKGVTWVGRANGRRYEVVTTGTLKFKVRSANGQMFVQSTGASGTITGKINGRVDWRQPLEAAVGPASYVCSGDVLNSSVERRDVELRRLSLDPNLKV